MNVVSLVGLFTLALVVLYAYFSQPINPLPKWRVFSIRDRELELTDGTKFFSITTDYYKGSQQLDVGDTVTYEYGNEGAVIVRLVAKGR